MNARKSGHERTKGLMNAQFFGAFIRPLVRSCPDFRAFMIRPSCVHQTIRAFMIRFSCVHQTIRAFMIRLSCVHQTIRAFMIRLSCVHQTIRAFMIRLFVRSPDYSCVHDQTFVRSPDYSCVHVQTFVRFSLFPDHVNLNARHPRRAFIWVWTYSLSVWDLKLGKIKPIFRLAM